VFEVDLYMPLVEMPNGNARFKQADGTLTTSPPKDTEDRSYKDYGAYKGNDHIYWS